MYTNVIQWMSVLKLLFLIYYRVCGSRSSSNSVDESRDICSFIYQWSMCLCLCVRVSLWMREDISRQTRLSFFSSIHIIAVPTLRTTAAATTADEIPLFLLFVFITMCKCGQRLEHIPTKWTVLTYNVGNEPLNSSNDSNNFQYHLFDKITLRGNVARDKNTAKS